MDLVERDSLLTELATEAESASRGNGRMVALAGAAGMGKTALTGAAVKVIRGAPWVLWGACDALSTPRALGPLHDMAMAVPAWQDLLDRRSDRHHLYRRILEDLERRFTVMVIEDLHWADDATLDLVRYIGRRIQRTRALLVVTFRDDEAAALHPLQVTLGDLATSCRPRRLQLVPLTLAGVRTLAADHEVDPEEVLRITGGNPFYVTEVLASPDSGVPQTVTDAVLARVARLDPNTVAVLETVSIEPGAVELRLLERLGHSPTAVEDALASGVVVSIGTRVSFRHELARLAVVESLNARRRVDLHEGLFEELASVGGHNAALLAYHAKGAGLGEQTLTWAEAAGRAASRAGSHREAAAHYADALASASSRPNPEQADLLAAYAGELEALDRVSEAIEARRRIVELRAGDASSATAHGDLAAALWRDGQGDEARRLVGEAVDGLPAIVETEGEAHLVAVAATLATLAREADDALALCERAVDAAARTGNDLALVRALNLRGSARLLFREDMGGVGDLEQAGQLAEAKAWHDRRGAVYTNLGSALGEIRRYDAAARHLRAGIEFSATRDLEANRNYCVAWLAKVRFDQGHWGEALELADEAMSGPADQSPIIPIVALTARGRVWARRGQSDAGSALEEAWSLARKTGELQRLWPVMAGRAELAWLTGDESVAGDLNEVLTMAEGLEYAAAVGELGFWAWKLALRPEVPHGSFAPYFHHGRGNLEAAQRWDEIGCPYEAAFARFDCGGETEQRQALSTLIDLGARPLGDRVRATLRTEGATGLANFPPTSRHPSGLSPRELEVLEWLARGMSDRDIADRLFISARTVNHHVASILRKLEASSRTEAAARAHREAWVGS